MNKINEKIKACFVEDKFDFEIIFNKYKSEKNIYIPLNIETYLLCRNKNVQIFDFNKYISNKFHIESLNISKKFSNSLKFKKNINYSLKSEIIGFLRFRLNSIALIIEISEILIKNFKVENFIVSGLRKEEHLIHKSKICNDIIENIYSNYLIAASSCEINNTEKNIYSYHVKKKIPKNNYKKAILSNAGYNFRKIILFFKKTNIKVFLPTFDKISLIDKIKYFFSGVKLINFYKKKDSKIEREDFIEDIEFIFKNKYDISKIMNKFYKKLNYYFNDLNQKIIALKSFINENNFHLSLSNIARGLDGSILDSDIKNSTLCIPHGVISEAFNENDIIYKKIIAEGVFNGESKYFAIQSKIMNESLSTHGLDGKKIITGNLIFSNLYKKSHKKKYVLFATTLKDFTNLQYLGVDMFYEYWSILDELNLISKERKEKFVVKVHPQFKSYTKNLSKNFKFLKFSNKRIDSLLKHAFSLISLSSGTIEDALNSKVPVILYDKNKRYKQMKIHKTDENGSAVHYINEKKQLELTLNEIKSCRKFNFNQYIYDYDLNKTLNEKILPLLNHEKNN